MWSKIIIARQRASARKTKGFGLHPKRTPVTATITKDGRPATLSLELHYWRERRNEKAREAKKPLITLGQPAIAEDPVGDIHGVDEGKLGLRHRIAEIEEIEFRHRPMISALLVVIVVSILLWIILAKTIVLVGTAGQGAAPSVG